LDPAVLGDALFIDAHGAGHDFDAADDGCQEAFGVVFDVVEDAVDAVADADVFFEGLDVDVGRAVFERLHEEVGAEFDDGGIIAIGESAADAHAAAHDGLIAIDIGHEGLDEIRCRAEELDVGLEDVGEGVEGFEVVRVSDDDLEGAAVDAEGSDLVFEGDVDGDELLHARMGRVAVEVHVFHAGVDGDGLGDLFVRNGAAFDEEFQGGIVGLLVGLGLGDIAFFQEARFLKQFEEILFVGIHAEIGGL
jgi:hypothetical protein